MKTHRHSMEVTDVCIAQLYTHSKILVAAVNGPVMGRFSRAVQGFPAQRADHQHPCHRYCRRYIYSSGQSLGPDGVMLIRLAAFLGHFDFIYALPSAWLSVPFTLLGKL